MQDIVPIIENIGQSDEQVYWKMLGEFGFDGDREHYERCFERHCLGELIIVTARLGVEVVGFCILNWQPKYSPFKRLSWPEIQDLNVLSFCRKQGVGRALIEYCEGVAQRKGCDEMGIGVGLNVSFGAAQRLYIKMGYIPDGSGVSYDRKQIATGEFRPIDGDLCLMMSKSLMKIDG